MDLKAGHAQTPNFPVAPSGDTAGRAIIIATTVPSSPYPVMGAPIPVAQPRVFYTILIVLTPPNSSSAMKRRYAFRKSVPKALRKFIQLSEFCVEVSKWPEPKKPNWMTDSVFSCTTTISLLPLQVGPR